MAEDKDTTQQAPNHSRIGIMKRRWTSREDAPPAKAPMIKIDDAVDGVVDATQSGIKRRSVFRRIGALLP